MRSAALLAAALAAAGCGGASSAEKHFLAQLRAVCAGLPGKSFNDAGGEFSSLGVPAVDDGCAAGRLPPFGSACPSGGVLCRVIWLWQPTDARLCSTVGDCIYKCNAYSPGLAGPVTDPTTIICGSDSGGP